jgi:uncharacterized protein YecE (DUF72 family)
MMNCNVMGNILGQIARAWPRFQAPYLPEFVGESRRCLSGHHGFSKARFEKDCLAEYAETFKTVCVDAAYYGFPSRQFLEGLAAQVPSDFQFAFKATDQITIKRFPDLPRFGERRGSANEHFLDADLFATAFLGPCEAIRPNVGIIMFEFSTLRHADYPELGHFVADLDAFLSRLPRGFRYGIELRNRTWLGADYFQCLARHDVAHVLNSWTSMPPVAEQLAVPGSRTSVALAAGRFLMKPGRTYEQSIQTFEPFDEVKEVQAEERMAAATLLQEGTLTAGKKTFLYVNNRLEGSAPATIQAVVNLAYR